MQSTHTHTHTHTNEPKTTLCHSTGQAWHAWSKCGAFQSPDSSHRGATHASHHLAVQQTCRPRSPIHQVRVRRTVIAGLGHRTTSYVPRRYALSICVAHSASSPKVKSVRCGGRRDHDVRLSTSSGCQTAGLVIVQVTFVAQREDIERARSEHSDPGPCGAQDRAA